VNRNSSAQSEFQRVPDWWKRDNSAECEWTGESDGEQWERYHLWRSAQMYYH